MMGPRRSTSLCFLMLSGAFMALSASPEASLPKTVSTKKSPCNLRVGPGKHFPIDWAYNYPNTPFKVLAEFQGWYKVKDFQGTTGWISRSLLTKRPSAIVIKDTPLYQTDRITSRVQATLKPHVIVILKSCAKTMCHVQLKHETLKTGLINEKNYNKIVDPKKMIYPK